MLMSAVHRQPRSGAASPRPARHGRARVGFACAVAGTALLSLVATGCGGGGGPSKADFVNKLTVYCRQAASQRRTLVPSANATPQQLVDALKQAVAVDKQLQQQITTLTPPSGDGPTIRELLSLMDQSDQIALQLADAIQAGNAPQMNTLYPKFNDLGTRTKELAGRYGLQACTEKL